MKTPVVMKELVTYHGQLAQMAKDLATVTLDDFKELTPYYRASPGYKARIDVPGCHHACVATLEYVLESILKAQNPERLGKITPEALAAARTALDKVPASGIIWPSTLADAVKAGLITQKEADQLQSAKPWDKKGGAGLNDIRKVLAADLKLLGQLIARYETVVASLSVSGASTYSKKRAADKRA